MNDIARPDFDTMPIAQLREYASHLHIPLAKTAKKEEIKQAIVAKLNGRTTAVMASEVNGIPPGHAKIIINEDPTPGANNYPIPFNVNGYLCTIPRGKEVIVPMRIIRALNDAKVQRLTQVRGVDSWGRETFQTTTVRVPSYPYQLLGSTPGPEPLTAHEKQKQRTTGPKQRYAQLFGRWPRPAELRRALEKGLISLHEDEHVNVPNDQMIEENEYGE